MVTATRTNLHYLVTEYGIFNAKGKSTWERAEGLISLAHPQFRDELIAAAGENADLAPLQQEMSAFWRAAPGCPPFFCEFS